MQRMPRALSLSEPCVLARNPVRSGLPSSLDAISDSRWIVVFPNSDDFPAHRSKCVAHPLISNSIGVEFCLPPLCIRLGGHGVGWASMPEASIDKDRNACSREDDVGTARKAAHVHSKTESPGMKFATYCHLRICARCAEPRHESSDGSTGRRRSPVRNDSRLHR